MYKDCDIIGPEIKCSQELRAYFKERLGKWFHFLVPFQGWLHANPDKTLADACCAYPEIARMVCGPPAPDALLAWVAGTHYGAERRTSCQNRAFLQLVCRFQLKNGHFRGY